MKGLFIPVFAALALNIAGAALAADGVKVASVDVRKIGIESKAGTELAKTMSKLADKLEGNLKAKQTELEKIKDALEGKGKKLSEKERASKEKEIQKKLGQYREFAQNAQNELQTKENQLAGKIMAVIEKTTSDYATKNGYALIIRKDAPLYSDGKLQVTDVTEDILKLVDAAPAADK